MYISIIKYIAAKIHTPLSKYFLLLTCFSACVKCFFLAISRKLFCVTSSKTRFLPHRSARNFKFRLLRRDFLRGTFQFRHDRLFAQLLKVLINFFCSFLKFLISTSIVLSATVDRIVTHQNSTAPVMTSVRAHEFIGHDLSIYRRTSRRGRHMFNERDASR